MRRRKKRTLHSAALLLTVLCAGALGMLKLLEQIPATADFLDWAGDELEEYTEETGLSFAEDPAFYVSRGYGVQAETDPVEPSAEPVSAPADAGPKPYPEVWDLTGGTVQEVTYTAYSGTRYFDLQTAGQVQNLTSITNEQLYTESKRRPAFDIEKNAAPQVLIMHTHTTETFEPYERDAFDRTFNYRTTDSSKNMVMVGDAIAAQLEAAGIAVIHDSTIHDYPSYTGSYERSAETVRAVLEQYPSIKVVLDIHRDAISRDGVISQPVAEIGGKKAAQVMIISGCDDGTMGMPNYMQNFRFACLLQQQMESDYPGLTRPVLFDYRKYNQDLTTGSLLIEVGSHGNTLAQAEYAGELIGRSLARALSGLS